MRADITPLFGNDDGVEEIRTGARRVGCIGERPPFDHPRVYLDVPPSGVVRCPYCGVRFRFDPRLAEDESRPAGARLTDEEAAPERA